MLIRLKNLYVISISKSGDTVKMNSRTDQSLMNGLSCLALMLLCLGSGRVYSQFNLNTDSLEAVLPFEVDDTIKVNRYLALGRRYILMAEYEKARTCADQALTLIQRLGFDAGLYEVNELSGEIYENQGLNTDALKYYLISMQIAQGQEDQLKIGRAFHNLGSVYWHLENYTEALKNYLSSLKIQEALGNQEGIGKDYCNIGILYDLQGRTEDAIDAYQKAMAIAREIHNPVGIGACNENLGIIYNGQGKYSEALTCHHAAL
ncbi:MAG TPA: tetratricopeptide repeat protein, partial [Saprospiraceae bacterium]|nr:tetratricopeptide repeat protein [Saprospiraceae bacterium]